MSGNGGGRTGIRPTPSVVADLPLLDALLADHAADIGGDFTAYRNHTFRLANVCLALVGSPDRTATDKIAIAAAFHDLGIWTAHTFDYLEPSAALAEFWLAASGRGAWSAEIVEMIRQHHKVSPYRQHPDWLVEPFRRADWADVTGGLLRSGLPRAFMRDLYRRWPDAGFHRLLVKLELRHLRRHPLNPLPVFRL